MLLIYIGGRRLCEESNLGKEDIHLLGEPCTGYWGVPVRKGEDPDRGAAQHLLGKPTMNLISVIPPVPFKLKPLSGTSLVAQWLRICLPMQGTQVWALVQEDPTCHGATKPMGHNYWACTLEPTSHVYWTCVPQLLKPPHLEPVLHNRRSHHNEKPVHRNKE